MKDNLDNLSSVAISVACKVISAAIAMTSYSEFMKQHYKNMMRPGYHVTLPPMKVKPQIIKLRTRKDMKQIIQNSESRKRINRLISKSNHHYTIPGRNYGRQYNQSILEEIQLKGYGIIQDARSVTTVTNVTR